MILKIKEKIRKIIRRIVFGHSCSPECYVDWLKNVGVSIGKGTIFFDPINTIVDTQNPKLISIGENVRITSGCKILTHDFSSSVLGGMYGQCIGALGTVDIGNNVFIGMNTVILRNTKIGDNVIIGAGSIVSGELESNSVYVGNPAKKMMTIDKFYERRLEKVQFEIENVISKIAITNKEEAWKYLREYCCDFQDSPEKLQMRQMNDTGYPKKCQQFYSNYEKKYKLDDFIKK